MAAKVAYTPDDAAELPLLWRGDVVVVGGGSAGSSAAVAAARQGANTLLIESGSFLGGTGTRVLDTFYGFYAPGADGKRVVGGIGWEVCEHLFGLGAAFERPNTYGAGTGVTYEPEALKLVWDELTTSSGVTLLLVGLMTAVILDGDNIVGVVVETKRGPRRVSARVTVDATGDGEVSWRAGVTTDNGNGRDSLQPGTCTFRIGGVTDHAVPTAELHRLMAAAADSGDYQLPRRDGSIHKTLIDGVRHTNLTRVTGRDLTDPWDLTFAEQEGRRQAWEYLRFLRDRVPGYENAYLLSTATRLGVRESRRLVGRYVLSRADFLGATRHVDDIALCGAPLEDHANGASTRWEYVGGAETPDGQTYGIPFRCLLPVEVESLIIAGRFLSATHQAHASARSIGQCMAMGQAAGTAAALAVRERTSPAALQIAMLQSELAAQHSILSATQMVVAS